MSDPNVTQDFLNVFCEFVEAVIHQVLHLRRVYKADLFERCRLYGITTRKSRHPGLNEYIHSVATSIKVLQLQACAPDSVYDRHDVGTRVHCCKDCCTSSVSAFLAQTAG